MKRPFSFLLAVALAMAAFAGLTVTHVSAAPIASFTASTSTPVVGEPVTLDATSSACDPGLSCSYTWSLTSTNRNHQTFTIAQLGRTAVVSWTPTPSDATRPSVTVLLKFTASNGTNNFRTAQQSFVVTPPPP